MSMPTYEISPTEKGGRTRAFAGRDILHELKRKRLTCKVIVVTQFESFGQGEELRTLDELKREMAANFQENYVDTVFYRPDASGWRTKLASAIAVAVR